MNNRLKLNKYYSLYTKEYYKGIQIKVVSINTYTNIIRISNFSIENLAINEKVVDFSKDNVNTFGTNDYLNDKEFYLCHVIRKGVEQTEEHIVVWDAIINYEETSLINTKKRYVLTLDIPINSSRSKKEIVDSIKTYVKTTYDINNEIAAYSDESDELDEHELLLEQINEIYKVLSLSKLTKETKEYIKMMNSGEFNEKLKLTLQYINEIKKDIQIIAEKT